MKKGAKDTFTMSQNFKQCSTDPLKKNFFMSTISTDGWNATKIKIHYHDQISVVCTIKDPFHNGNVFLKVGTGRKSRLPLSCNPGMKYIFKTLNYITLNTI